MVQLVGTWNEIITTDPNDPKCNEVTMVSCFLLEMGLFHSFVGISICV